MKKDPKQDSDTTKKVKCRKCSDRGYVLRRQGRGVRQVDCKECNDGPKSVKDLFKF